MIWPVSALMFIYNFLWLAHCLLRSTSRVRVQTTALFIVFMLPFWNILHMLNLISLLCRRHSDLYIRQKTLHQLKKKINSDLIMWLLLINQFIYSDVTQTVSDLCSQVIPGMYILDLHKLLHRNFPPDESSYKLLFFSLVTIFSCKWGTILYILHLHCLFISCINTPVKCFQTLWIYN